MLLQFGDFKPPLNKNGRITLHKNTKMKLILPITTNNLNPNPISISYRVLVHRFHVYSIWTKQVIRSKFRIPKICFLKNKEHIINFLPQSPCTNDTNDNVNSNNEIITTKKVIHYE